MASQHNALGWLQSRCCIWQWLRVIPVLAMATPRKAASWSEEHGSNHFHFCKMRGLNSSMAWKIKIQIRQNPFIKQILCRSCVCKTGPSSVNSGGGEAGKCRVCSSSRLPHQIRLWRTHSLSCWTRWSLSLIPVLQLQGSVIRLSRAPGQTKIAICLAFGVDVSQNICYHARVSYQPWLRPPRL